MLTKTEKYGIINTVKQTKKEDNNVKAKTRK